MARDRRGFTLVEAMVVVALIGILAGVGGFYLLTQLPTMRVNGATRQVVGDFRLAKTLAVERGTDVLVQFHAPATGQYVVAFDTDDSQDYTPGTDELEKVVDIAAQYRGVEFATSDPGAPASAVPDGVSFVSGGNDNLASFSPSGTSDTGSIYLRPSADPAAGRTDRERRVTVAGPTARARSYRWSGSGWN